MNTVPISDKIYLGSVLPASYFRKNLIIEKRSSVNWLKWLYKESLIKDLLMLLTSRLN